MMKIYNPTYGALFEVDEAKPADPEEIGKWVLSYAAKDRGLTEGEIKQLKQDGKIGSYPDEFYLVDAGEWSTARVAVHQNAVQVFKAIDEGGPVFRHADKEGNRIERIGVRFAPGPIVNVILDKEGEEAAANITEIILSSAASRYRRLKSFQKSANEHAKALVKCVKVNNAGLESPPTATHNLKPIERKILAYLSQESGAKTPKEIAEATELNRNTVRRELQEMLSKQLLKREEHHYLMSEVRG